ncbi:hypothetical protein BS47DRAFT_1347783 [Hydnum rufescens UP504]|uniref:Uncharacterized protein n=1 Tax=Hydnum rufescens UP504 TaxID=1448309 RepID=A0A9P6ARI3_9AGAM|nr:hypothetical protein BS47DRAFT_1347783 [Hydnum rufescens UP504]
MSPVPASKSTNSSRKTARAKGILHSSLIPTGLLPLTLYPRRAPQSNLHHPPKTPWFVDPNEEIWDFRNDDGSDTTTSILPSSSYAVAPADAPHHLHILHRHLVSLPLLEPSTVQITRPSSEPSYDAPPPLPYRKPQGKRRRGGTPDAGEGVGDPPPLWSWVVLAQVKRGAEGKGAIDTVIQSSRNLLAPTYPHLALRRKLALGHTTSDGWGFLDAGDFALHVLTYDARRKWFSTR